MSNKPKLQELTVRKATSEQIQYYNNLIEKESKKLHVYKKLNIDKYTTKLVSR